MNLKRRVGRWLVLAIALPAATLSACAGAAGSPSPTETAADLGMGCAQTSAKETLTTWAGSRGGVVRAHVQLTGKQATTDDHGLLSVYSELKITDPKVVAGHGPDITSGWVLGGKRADGTPELTRGPVGSLWGPDGTAVLVIDPAHTLAGNPGKVELHITPVVGNDIVFTNAGCWGFQELRTTAFSGDLSEVPGSETADAMHGNMSATPYADFASLAQKVLS